MSKTLQWFLCSLSLVFFPSCKIGFVSFGDKGGNLFRGTPLKPSMIEPVPEKLAVDINGSTDAVVPFSLGFCSGPIKVQTRSSVGALADVRVPTKVLLNNVLASKLFSDANCVVNLPTESGVPVLTIQKGGNEAEFYFKDSLATSQVSQLSLLRVSSTGYPDSLRTLRVDRTLVSLGLAGNNSSANPLSIGGGMCQGLIVWGKDGVGQPFFPISTSVTVGFAGAGSGSFYSNSNCSGAPISSVILNSPTGAVLYYKNLQVGESTTFITSNTNNLTNASLAVSMISVPYRLRFRSPLPQTNIAGLCQAFTIDFVDSANGSSNFGTVNLTISVAARLVSSGVVSGDLYRGTNCQGSLISALSPNAASDTSVNFSFKANGSLAHGSLVYFETSKVGLIGDSTLNSPLTISTEVRKLSFAGDFTNPRLGICNSLTPLTVNVFDGRLNSGGGDVPYTRGTNLTLSKVDGGVGQSRFYADPSCENEFIDGVMPIPAGSGSRSFYYRDDSINDRLTLTLKASGPQMTGGQFPETTKSINFFAPLLEEPAFGNGGSFLVGLGAMQSAEISGFVLGNSGKYLAVGTSDQRMISLRISANGAREYLRPVSVPNFSETTGYAVAVDGLGSVIAGTGVNLGDPNASPPLPSVREYVLARLDSSGVISTLRHGVFDSGVGENVATHLVKMGTKYIVGGYISDGTIRTGMIGVFDASLSLENTLTTSVGQPVGLNAVDNQSFFVVGNTGQTVNFSRYDTLGNLLCSNALTGKVASASTLSQGKLYVAARQSSQNALQIFRVLSNCLIDSSFAVNGVATDTSTSLDETRGIVVYPSNLQDPDIEKIIIVGSRGSAGARNFLVSRYTKMGAPDSVMYFREKDMGAGNDLAAGGVVIANGKIILGGISGLSLGVAAFLR